MSEKNITDSPDAPPVVACSDLVRLQGVRVKLKNRRVFAALGPDQKVWLKFVRLEGRKREVTSIKLSQEAAAATVSAMLVILDEVMATGTGKQPNDRISDPAKRRVD